MYVIKISYEPLLFWLLFMISSRYPKSGSGMLSLNSSASALELLMVLHNGKMIYCLMNFSLVNLFAMISLVAKTNNQMTKHFHLVL